MSHESGVFAWSATLRKILTMDNLRKRHVIMVDWCCRCKRSGETIDDLLLHCEIARALWNTIFSRIGLACIIPRRVVTFSHVGEGKLVVLRVQQCGR
jgi:hypothetical protein